MLVDAFRLVHIYGAAVFRILIWDQSTEEDMRLALVGFVVNLQEMNTEWS
jgi:hypothetical protein